MVKGLQREETQLLLAGKNMEKSIVRWLVGFSFRTSREFTHHQEEAEESNGEGGKASDRDIVTLVSNERYERLETRSRKLGKRCLRMRMTFRTFQTNTEYIHPWSLFPFHLSS